MLMPKRVKHRKVMRGRMSGVAKGGYNVAFGEYGLATQEPAWITSRQIEAARRAMTRSVKRGGKIWIRVFPDKPATKKPAETRMGSGKGAPDHWVAVVKPGRILFEMAGVDRRVGDRGHAPRQPQAARRHPGRPPRVGQGGELMDIDRGSRSCPTPSSSNALREAKQDLWGARFALSTRQLKDYSTIPQTRRTIARILTVQRERGARPAGCEGDQRDDRSRHAGAVQGKRKTKVGRVVSDKMDKTIVVSVERLARHRLYKRVIRLTHEVQGPRRGERGPHRRHGPHRGIASAVGHQALAPGVDRRPCRRPHAARRDRDRGGRDLRGDPRRRPPGPDA